MQRPPGPVHGSSLLASGNPCAERSVPCRSRRCRRSRLTADRMFSPNKSGRRNAKRKVRSGWIPALGTRGFHRPLSDPSTDLQVRCHGSERDGRDVPKAESAFASAGPGTRPSAGLSVSIAHRGLIEEQQRVLAWPSDDPTIWLPNGAIAFRCYAASMLQHSCFGSRGDDARGLCSAPPARSMGPLCWHPATRAPKGVSRADREGAAGAD